MGVDIVALTNIRKVDALFDECGDPVNPVTREPYDNAWRLYHAPSYSDRADGIEDGKVYEYDASVHHASLSYGAYNIWRDHIARLAGWPKGSYEQYGRNWDSYAASAWDATEGPLWELINFSDCEGVIGPKTSAKIAADLRALTVTEESFEGAVWAPHFVKFYNEMVKIFEAAAGNGCVRYS